MTGPLATLNNRLLSALPSEDRALLTPHLSTVDLERGRLLYDPGDAIDHVYFPIDCVISLMTLMESGAAIESALIGREGGLGPMVAVAPRQSLSRAIVQAPGSALRIAAGSLHDVWKRSAALRDLVDRHNEALFGHAIQSVAC